MHVKCGQIHQPRGSYQLTKDSLAWFWAINHAFGQITYVSQHWHISLERFFHPYDQNQPQQTSQKCTKPISDPSHCHHRPHIIPFSPFPMAIRLNKEGNQWWMKLIIKPWRFESQVFRRSFLKRASWKYTSSATTRQVQRKFNMSFLPVEVFCHFLLRFAIFLGHVYI